MKLKKILLPVLIILAMISLSSCKGKEKSYFEKLYDENYKTVINEYETLNYLKKYKKYSYRQYKIYNFVGIVWVPCGLYDIDEILDKYKFVNIIISEFYKRNEGCQPEIIECLNEEDAKKLSEELSKGMYSFFYKENIVYNSTLFSVLFINGNSAKIDKGLVYSDDGKILIGKNERLTFSEFEIPEQTEVLGQFSLYLTETVKKIICNDNLKKITRTALAVMKDLEEVVLNEGLTTLGPACFDYCLKLNKINIPSTLKEIYTLAFYDCESLEYIVIPKNVEYIGRKVFNKTNVYCEVESKPDAWDDEFICEDAKVYWAGEWEYNEDGIPTPTK